MQAGFAVNARAAVDAACKCYSITFRGAQDGMRFVRAHQISGAWLALAALLVQFVVSFAHIHRDDLVPVVSESVPNASPLNPALPDDSRSPPPARDHDFCMICASMTLVGSVVLPQPPTVVLANVPCRVGLTERAILLAATDQDRYFQARGPPI